MSACRPLRASPSFLFSQAADETGRAILTTTATGATALTDARYGPRAAAVAHDTGLTAVSAYRVMRFPSKFGATTIVKTFATTTADGTRGARAGGPAGVGSGVAAAAAAGPADWQVGGLPGAPGGAAPVGGGGARAPPTAAGSRGEHTPASAYAATRGAPDYHL